MNCCSATLSPPPKGESDLGAADLASDVDLRLRPPRKFWSELADAGSEQSRRGRRDPRLPAAGTILARNYQGKTVCSGLYQVNLIVPAGSPDNDATALVISANGQDSASVTFAVRTPK